MLRAPELAAVHGRHCGCGAIDTESTGSAAGATAATREAQPPAPVAWELRARVLWSDLGRKRQCVAARPKQCGCVLVWVDVLLWPGTCLEPRRADDVCAGAVVLDVGVARLGEEARAAAAACDWRRRRPRLLHRWQREREAALHASNAPPTLVEVDGGAKRRSRSWSGRWRQRRRRRVGRSKRRRKHCRPQRPVRLRSAVTQAAGASCTERVFGSCKARSTSRLSIAHGGVLRAWPRPRARRRAPCAPPARSRRRSRAWRRRRASKRRRHRRAGPGAHRVGRRA